MTEALEDNASYGTSQDELDKELPFDEKNLSLLAKGGFGTVFSTHHKVSQIPLVVKISHMAEDEDGNENKWDTFETELDFYEARSGRAGFSWMPAYYGSGVIMYQQVRCPWIALEHLDSCLWQLNHQGKAADQFRHLALGALKALEGLHAEGYVHRDVKLENFAVRKCRSSNEYQVCCLDFGLILPYKVFPPEGDKIDYLQYIGTLEYSSDRQLQDYMVGPADDLESLGYSILELYIGEPWWEWEKRHKSKNQNLQKFVEENQANVLSTRLQRKRGREAQQEEQKQLLLVSANNRPRNQARLENEKKEEEHAFEARIVLAPAPAPAASLPPTVAAPAAAAPNPPVFDPEATQDRMMTLGEKCDRMIMRRRKVWKRLDKQGLVPSFLKEWMRYCKSLSAYECPDFEKLRNLLKTAPEVAHIAQVLHGKKPTAMQQEE